MTQHDPSTGGAAPESRGGHRAAERLLPGRWTNPALDRLTRLAARLLDTPSAMATLLTDVETVVGGANLPTTFPVGSARPITESICADVAAAAAPLLVSDTRTDARYAEVARVASGEIVAYLGVPLVGDAGDVVGALCVFDTRPRDWSDTDATLLSELSAWAIADLELAALTREFDGSRTRWDLAIDAADMGTFELDPVNNTLDWDDRLIALFGYAGRGDDEFDGTLASVERRVHPDDMDRVSSAIEQALATIGEIHVRYRIVLPDGRLRWLQARGRTVAGADGTAASMLGVTFDVTAQQDALQRVQRVVGGMPVGVMGLDEDFVVTWANRQAEVVTHVPVSTMVGRTMWELFPGTVGTVFEDTYRRVAQTRLAEVFEAFYPEPLDIWVEVRTVPADDDGGILVTFIDVTAQHEVRDLLQLSVDVGEALVGAPDTDAAVAVLASRTVPHLADWAIVSLAEDDGRVRDVGSSHRDPAKLEAVQRYQARRLENGGSGIVQEVLSSGESQLITGVLDVGRRRLPTDDAKSALAALEPESAAVVPLVHNDVVIGVLTLYRGGQRAPMTEQELAVTSSICRRAALTVANRRLLAALAESAEHERGVAHALQQALLTSLPTVPGLDIAARYLPAADRDRVGGDWYDAIVKPDGSLVLTIGDVLGHDISAAAVMGQLRGTARTLAWDRDETPGELLQRVDLAIRGMQLGAVATAVAGHLELAAGGAVLRWSNAGHPAPIVIRADGPAELLERDPKEPLLGVAPEHARSTHELAVRSGDTLLLFTDGLVERRGEILDAGFARLLAAVDRHRSGSLDALLDRVVADLVVARSEDDVAVIAVRILP